MSRHFIPGNSEHYDVQQVCLNGHVITALLEMSPDSGQAFCADCGEPTICACEYCKTPLRGANVAAMTLDIFYQIPHGTRSYCSACGKPYPWTQKRMAAAMEAAREVEGIKAAEFDLLNSSLPDLGKNTPRSDLAAIRWKKFLLKAGDTVGPLLKKLVSEIATSEIKQKMGLH